MKSMLGRQTDSHRVVTQALILPMTTGENTMAQIVHMKFLRKFVVLQLRDTDET
jgi:hypothetical protein